MGGLVSRAVCASDAESSLWGQMGLLGLNALVELLLGAYSLLDFYGPRSLPGGDTRFDGIDEAYGVAWSMLGIRDFLGFLGSA